MVVAVNLLVTFVVFWALLMPQGISTSYLLSFDNIAVHTVTPLLCLLDYVLFSKPRSLKYRDVYYVCIFPLCYLLFVGVAGMAGYTYLHGNILSDALEVTVSFPYYFLDFNRLGTIVFVYIGAILVFFLLVTHVIYFIDQKVRKPKQVGGER
jgi:hypothetical protein